jgi:phosphohistidine phosphatase
MGFGTDRIQPDERIYEASIDSLLSVLSETPATHKRVMMVGHNPEFEHLLGYLADKVPEIPADGKLMPTATIAHLTMHGDWSSLQQGSAQLQQLVRASTLNKKFPYPEPDSQELRDRPAYYYTQSSVIPYRMNSNSGEFEILIVRSSKDKHWVVPKGIAEPGLTLQESARKEAWEEAGVEGDITQQAIGSYQYSKWGATCTCTVFPMAVTREIPEEKWQERHRGRLWVTPEEAARLLKQAELGPMIFALEKQLLGN